MRSKTIKKVIASAVVAAMAITSIVPAAPAQAAVKAKKLTVKTKKITLYKGAAAGYGSMKLKVTVKPKKAKVTYKINKKKIATVSKKGVVKAKKPGKAKITVKSGSKKVVVKVVVKKIKKKVTKVTAPKNVTVKVGAKQKIKTSVKPKKATLKKLTFKSSAKKIAKVNAKGVITGVKAGKAKITVMAVDGSKKKATVSVVVTGAAVTSSPAVAATTPAVSKAPATTAPTKAPATTEPTKAPATKAPATTEPTKAPATDAPATTEPAQTATTPAVVVPTTEGGVAKYVIPALGENESYKVSFGGETVAVTDKTVAVFNETVKRFTSSSKDAAKAAASFKAKAYAGVTVAGAKITKDANAEKATVELDGQTYSLDVKADGEAAKVVVENGNTKMTADIAGSNNAYTVSNLTYGNVKVEGTKTATTEVAEDGTVTATIGSCKIVVKADGSATLDIPEAVMTKYDFKIAK